MNNTRRDEIARTRVHIEEAFRLLKQARNEIDSAKDEEENTFSEASEGKQNGDWGQESQACTEAMQTLIDAIDSVDISEEMDELGRAIDRTLEAPKGRLTKAEADARRSERLPKWAQDELRSAVERMNAAIEKSKAKFEDWKEGSDHGAFYDFLRGPLEGKEIPTEYVSFPQLEIRVNYDKHRQALCIHGDGFTGMLAVVPGSANEVYIKVLKDR